MTGKPDSPALASQPATQPGPVYLTLPEVAELLRLSPKSVYRLAQEPTFPVLKLPGGRNATLRFPRERLLRWLRDREQGRRLTRNQLLPSSKSAPKQETGP